MKISDTQSHAPVVKLSEKRAADPQSDPSSETKASDPVSLSPQAREYTAAQRSLAVIPDIRESKVSDIKARIADGSYTIDSDKIAENMIREAISDKE